MFDLTRAEKIIILFLISTLLAGIGINLYKKARQKICLDVQAGRVERYEQAADEGRLLININSQNTDELMDLPGVGRQLAGRIIQYRQENGPFKDKEDIMRVPGIGAKKFEAIKDLIAVR